MSSPSNEELFEFSQQVGNKLHELFDYEDGDDLCFNLVLAGRISLRDGVDSAVQLCAQHIGQP